LKKYSVLLLALGFLVLPLGLFADAIDDTNKYARFLDDDSLINFNPANGNVDVTDSGMTGYAWATNAGWINLNPTNGGVVNDGSGNLSGYAWGEGTGWINFDPANGGVTIASDGTFSGYAWSQTRGWIVFNCATDSSCGSLDHKVQRVVGEVLGDTGGGGGTTTTSPPPVPDPTPDPTPPPVPDPDPVPTPEPEPTPEPTPTPSPVETPDGTPDFVDNVTRPIAEFAESTTGKVVQTVGVIVGGASVALAALSSISSIADIILWPIRAWGWLIGILGFRKRHRPWGTVYDSITKQPLDPAYVSLYDLNGNEIMSAITDLDGRYGFILDPGTYKIVANKTNYKFPSEKLAGKQSDELYNNLYFGGPIEIRSSADVINYDIPLDPLKFDWNEFQKKDKKLLRFYSHTDKWITYLFDFLFYIGFFVSLIAFYYTTGIYNTVILVLYITIFILRIFGVKQRLYGKVHDKNGDPLSFGIIRVFSVNLGREISHRVLDKFGRYYMLVNKGNYYVTIEKKMPDGSYEKIFISDPFYSQGIIKKAFKV